MKIPWARILGAAGAVMLVGVVGRYFGRSASLAALGTLLVGWWLVHVYVERRVDGLYRQFRELDEEGKKEALAEFDPEIRKDIEKRISKENNG
jgi:hypothetical protein